MLQTSVLVATLALTATVLAQQTCDENNKCPQSAPCCSQYGACGTGAYCLGGCDPRASFALNACAPAPVCVSKTYSFENLDGVTAIGDYLGDSSKTDWVMDGEAVPFDGNTLLTMADGTAGTVLASTTYMWYGNVKATFRTSRDQGVITAFILFSDVKDEIDYEFVGADLQTAQTNYFHLGILDNNNGKNVTLSDTFANFHTYEIDWTPDTVTWLVDGQVGRVLNRNETFNATSNQWGFPQTPARVQLSIWPGGLSTNAPGTIAWAGGVINWDSQDMQNPGYYYATLQSVEVSCFQTNSPPGTSTGVSYTYNNLAGTNDTVIDGTDGTVLASLLDSGLDMDANAAPSSSPSASASGSSASASASQSSSPQTVPGQTNTGPGADSHGDGDSQSSAAGGQGTTTSGSPESTATGWSQGGGGSTGSSTTKSGADKLTIKQDRVLGSSLFAAIVAVVAMLAI